MPQAKAPPPVNLRLESRQSQNIRQLQRLIMSKQMQQALHLLQVPILELTEIVEEELEQNPLLENNTDNPEKEADPSSIELDTSEKQEEKESSSEKELSFDEEDFTILNRLDEDFRDYFSDLPPIKRSSDEEKQLSFLQSSISSPLHLFDHLMKQASEEFDTPEELRQAEAIIGNVDRNGFLSTPLEEIAALGNFNIDQLEKNLLRMQTFSPAGILARTLQESLLIQLREKNETEALPFLILLNCFSDLLHNRIPLIAKQLGYEPHAVQEAIYQKIAALDLHPGLQFDNEVAQTITPDAAIKHEGEKLEIVINKETLPELRFNRSYLKMLNDPETSTETKDFIKQKIASAKWLFRNIDQRNSTLEKILHSLVTRQADFFLHPNGQLTPLIMKTLAEELQMNESTIARTVASKYVDTPRGTFSLRFFFSSGYTTEDAEEISSRTVKEALFEILEKENKSHPLSDQALSEELKKKGIPCARRTVAKYRKELSLGNTQQRRKYL